MKKTPTEDHRRMAATRYEKSLKIICKQLAWLQLQVSADQAVDVMPKDDLMIENSIKIAVLAMDNLKEQIDTMLQYYGPNVPMGGTD